MSSTNSLLLRARFAKDEIDEHTKHWIDYPATHFVDRTRAQNLYDSFIEDVWGKPKRMARSASLTNLTYVKDKQTWEAPIKRTDSVSSLAPSLALPQYCREAPRIVHTQRVYKPSISRWYNDAYAKAQFKDTHAEIARPYKPLDPPVSAYSSHVPYYTFQTKRIFFDQKIYNNRSYLRGSQKYLDRYVSARLKADDFGNQFAYTAYEWRRPQDHAFNRHFMSGSAVSAPHAYGLPESFYDRQHLRRLYKDTGRFYF